MKYFKDKKIIDALIGDSPTVKDPLEILRALLILSILLLSTINHNSMNMAIASLFLCMTPKYYYKRTPLTRALSIRVLKRYTGSAKKILEKGKECVGKGCEPFVAAAQNNNSNTTPSSTPTSQPTNAAAELKNNPPSSDSSSANELPLENLIKENSTSKTSNAASSNTTSSENNMNNKNQQIKLPQFNTEFSDKVKKIQQNSNIHKEPVLQETFTGDNLNTSVEKKIPSVFPPVGMTSQPQGLLAGVLVNHNLKNQDDALTVDDYAPPFVPLSIPPAPPMPSKSLSTSVDSPSTPITNAVLKDQTKKLKKPFLNVPENTKIPYTNTDDTTGLQLKDEEISMELIKRGLAKGDLKNTDTTFITENGDTVVVGLGNQILPIKLNSHGHVYGKEIKKKKIIQYEDTNENKNLGKLVIITVPPDENTVLATGKQTHAMLAVEFKDYYDILGGLTSKTNYYKIAITNFKKFQEQGFIDKEDPEKKLKGQHFMPSLTRERVLKKDAIVLKGGVDYIEQIKQEDYFRNLQENLFEKPYSFFDTLGYTRNDLIDICKDFNTNIKENAGHYITDAEVLEKEKQNKIKEDKKKKKEANDNDDATKE
jgi:hypothetical protein